ncbi:hypothetical protein FJT64_011958 [Amphibalanus amphitrite]|uniref:Uncharacterized protein n=1 Tax=Amphibalanus amphitrite TaxID=1232801 RepID=A0A6A4VE40_AMPAM|nr:hypothetical protein FJT64_011958 [Amphibalanus amphitrite]
MDSREMRELAAMVASFDARTFDQIKPEVFIGFGMKNSHIYRQMFMPLTKNMSKVDRTWVINLSTAVKNRERILTGQLERDWVDPTLTLEQPALCCSAAHEAPWCPLSHQWLRRLRIGSATAVAVAGISESVIRISGLHIKRDNF